MENKKIVIIGAGVSGLVATINLEKAGYEPIIYEQKDRVGGRVQTDYIDGYTFDKGFQILSPNYPAVQKYLDIDLLHLKYFFTGAFVFKKGEQGKLGNPAKDFDILFSTLFSKLANFSDKLKIIKLYRSLKYKTFEEIFNSKNQTTLDFLKSFGFSDKVINNFFKPFYAGVFLEENLDTSSRMFEFTFKLFSETKAGIPEKGIQAIPNQLANQLKQTTFHFNTKVKSVEDNAITLANHTQVEADFIIIATETSDLVSNLKNQPQEWKSVDNLYFEVENRVINLPMIGLVAEENTLVNNFHYLSLASEPKQILSVSVVKNHNLSNEELAKITQKELLDVCDIKINKLLKHYKIPKALPNIADVNYQIPHTETKLKDRIFLAGDVLSNGSLNAAMLNGESLR
ncbi:NAD(P)/FAD-dependent oxidoreductase [Flavobacterium sp. CS20]|uniref:protoporphyrinogen/coproporphyrinogen oxidase n=1 Tax=Flavobacterium sp. CS20 TaxID=2775246 RepID=UPI001B3A408D|nr:NAD(P)/FAD-dependent oxidoreductase [Flavobacterium sp. CS20]QTY27764.1 FAD-dependent oxidoreductase [Flavobacterium sp. CS20]